MPVPATPETSNTSTPSGEVAPPPDAEQPKVKKTRSRKKVEATPPEQKLASVIQASDLAPEVAPKPALRRRKKTAEPAVDAAGTQGASNGNAPSTRLILKRRQSLPNRNEPYVLENRSQNGIQSVSKKRNIAPDWKEARISPGVLSTFSSIGSEHHCDIGDRRRSRGATSTNTSGLETCLSSPFPNRTGGYRRKRSCASSSKNVCSSRDTSSLPNP